jgi:hypothetical protein
MTKICVLADSHNQLSQIRPDIPNDIDILIHCGDATYFGLPEELVKFNTQMGKINAKHKLFIGGNHECLDKETELLTKDGWKTYLDINKEDQILSLNKEGNTVWTGINDIIIKKSEFIHKYKNGVMDFAVTENHRIAYYFYHSYSRNYSELRYSTLNELPHSIHIPTAAMNINPDYDVSDDVIRLLGWIFTDGSYSQKHGIKIWQSKEEGIAKITQILNNLNLKYSFTTRDRNITSICGKVLKSIRSQCSFYIFSESRDFIEEFMEYGKIPKTEVFNKFSSRQLRILLTSMMDGDGSWHKTRTCGALNGLKPFLNWVQTLAVQCGIRTNLVEYRPTHFRLNLAFNLSRNNQLKVKKKAIKEYYNDDVWCLSVPFTNFMVRRNGTAYFTGNCSMDINHPKYSSAAIGYLSNMIVLINSSIEINGLKIFTCSYGAKLPRWGFTNVEEETKKRYYDTIPEGIDILVTHCPPYGILDGDNWGCWSLREALDRIQPRYLFCGHVHSDYATLQYGKTTVVNAACLNEQYVYKNKPVLIEI